MEESEQQRILQLITDRNLIRIYSSNSLHVFEERYDVDGVIYAIYSYFGHGGVDVELYVPPVDIFAIIDNLNSKSETDFKHWYYQERHVACPECASIAYTSKQRKYKLDLVDKIKYRDNNQVHCDCGHPHKIHDRIPLKPFNK